MEEDNARCAVNNQRVCACCVNAGVFTSTSVVILCARVGVRCYGLLCMAGSSPGESRITNILTPEAQVAI